MLPLSTVNPLVGLDTPALGGLAALTWVMLGFYLWFNDSRRYPWQLPAGYVAVGNSAILVAAGIDRIGYVLLFLTGLLLAYWLREDYGRRDRARLSPIADGGIGPIREQGETTDETGDHDSPSDSHQP